MIAALLFVLSGPLSPAKPPDVPQAVASAGIPATVRLTDPANGSIGSGAVVGVHDGYVFILTAAHILTRDSKPTVEVFTAKSLPKPVSTYPGCETLFRAPGPDIALVRLPAGKRKWANLQLTLAGGKEAAPHSAWAIGCDDTREPRISAITLTGRKLVRRLDGTSAFFWQAKGKAIPGRSGGPLLDRNGRLIGICSGTQGNMSYYVHPDEIYALLHREAIAMADRGILATQEVK